MTVKQEIVLVVGIQASGKTTIAQNMVENEAYVRVCRDDLGGNLDGLVPYVRSALKMGRNVVMDNTFMTAAIRKPFIELAREHGADIRCIELQTSFEDAQFNAVQRMIQVTGRLLEPHEIKAEKNPNIFPPVVQYNYRKNYEPPHESEGYSSIEKRPFVRSFDKTYKGKALILDFDGTLRRTKSGANYPIESSDVEVLPGRTEILKKYAKKKYKLLGVSNQSGISKGELTNDMAKACFDKTNELLGMDIEYAYCPHPAAPPICYCRKPSVGFGVHFIEKYKLNPAESIFVGDLKTDETFSERCGFKFVHADEFFK